MADSKPPVALIILDGFGLREPAPDNAISTAHTPVWDTIMAKAPNVALATSGEAVGLPEGQMGNSEVGHMNLGAGRIIYQHFTRINNAIDTGAFRENAALKTAMQHSINAGKCIHLLGLVSPGGVHSHEHHLIELCTMAVALGAQELALHAILDGRDTPPQSAKASLIALEKVFAALGVGRIASVIGRYYAMDRDQRWDRVQQAYDLYTTINSATAPYQAPDAIEALTAAYARGETDEFVKATRIGAQPILVQDQDTLIFANFRPDRAREITRAFIDPDFSGFERQARPKLGHFVMMTQYADDLQADCAYPPETIHNSLGEWLAKQGKTQLRIAETEKYAHVTFFFNGGVEKPYEGEIRILVKSPDVATYDLKPEMSAFEVTDKLVEVIRNRKVDFIVCNYANGDMVGHTGNFAAAVAAVEALDLCLGRVLDALNEVKGQALVTADHGNCEQMLNPDSGQPFTSHTDGPVPLVYVGPQSEQITLKSGGALCDIAPSLLTLMGLAVPDEMTGRSLVEFRRA